MRQPLADRPPQTLRAFHGPPDTIAEMRRAALGPRGEQSAVVNSVKNSIVRDLEPKDYLSEILAVRFFVAERIRYSNDALHVEQVQDPERLCDQIIKYGKAVGDCDDSATLIATLCLQLGREAEFITAGFGKPGHYTHVFARVKEPKSGRWIVCDPVAGPDEASMIRRVTTYKIWEI
jgi:hypothetical protein